MQMTCEPCRDPVWAHVTSPFCTAYSGNELLESHNTSPNNASESINPLWKANANELDSSFLTAHATAAECLDQRLHLSKRHQIDEILQKMHDERMKDCPRKTCKACQAIEIAWNPDISSALKIEASCSSILPNCRNTETTPLLFESKTCKSQNKRLACCPFMPPLFVDFMVTEEEYQVPSCMYGKISNASKFVESEHAQTNTAIAQSGVAAGLYEKLDLAASLASFRQREQKLIDEILIEMHHVHQEVEKRNTNIRATEIFWNPETPTCLGMEIICSVNNDLFKETKNARLPCSDQDICKKSPQTKRKVHFGPSILHEYATSSCDSSALWWKRSDFKVIMTENLHTASKARQQPIVAEGLDRAVQLAVTMDSFLGDRRQLDELLDKMEEEHRGLQLWCQYGHMRRGLERFTSRPYNEIRRKQMNELSSAIVALSKHGADPELIREASEHYSSAFAIFARMLGIADCNAATSLLPGESEHWRCEEEDSGATIRSKINPDSP